MVLIGPKIFPPFDSAYSSIGFNLLKTLLRLMEFNNVFNKVVLISSFDLDSYVKLYNQQIVQLLDYKFLDIMRRHISIGLFVKHTWSYRDNISLNYSLLEFLIKEVKNKDKRIIVQSLIPLELNVLFNKLSIHNVGRIKFTYYLFHVLSPKIMHIFRVQFYDQIIVSSQTILYSIKHILGRHVAVVYPPVDTEFFKPLPITYVTKLITTRFEIYKELIEAKERGKILLLYTGPVHPDRLPTDIIVKSLRFLRHSNLLLVIITTVRYVGKDDKYISLWKNISKKLGGEVLKVYIRVLSEEEKLVLYNLADIILYPAIKPWSMAIPPLTVLEAYACAKPVILSSCIPGYEEVVPEGFEDIVITRPNAEELTVSLKNSLNLSTRELCRLREFCVKRHSIDVVSRHLLSTYEKLVS